MISFRNGAGVFCSYFLVWINARFSLRDRRYYLGMVVMIGCHDDQGAFEMTCYHDNWRKFEMNQLWQPRGFLNGPLIMTNQRDLKVTGYHDYLLDFKMYLLSWQLMEIWNESVTMTPELNFKIAGYHDNWGDFVMTTVTTTKSLIET